MEFVYAYFGGAEGYLLRSRCLVVVQALLVTRMHRGFWGSERAFYYIATDISLTTWMIGGLDFM
jgi:hypothetical protein